MVKIKLKDKLNELLLLHDDTDPEAHYKGCGHRENIESIFRGSGFQGNGSRIFKGHEKGGEGRVVALKQIFFNENYDDSTDADSHAVITEISFLQQLAHDNIVRLYTTFCQPSVHDELWMVFEYCEGGSLAEAMRIRDGPLKESEIRSVLLGVLPALSHLHNHKVIHRDIKCENILLRGNGDVVLADLGSAISFTTSAKGIAGTCHWMSPEMASGKAYNEMVDIWSMGISVIEMAEMDTPAMREGGNETMTSMSSPKLVQPEQWSEELISFVDICLRMEPPERSSAEHLLQMCFFSKHEPQPLALHNLLAMVAAHNVKEEALWQERDRRRQENGNNCDSDDEWGNNSSHLGNSLSDFKARDSATSLEGAEGVTPAVDVEMNGNASHSSLSRVSVNSIHFDPVKSPPEVIPETRMKMPHSYPARSQGPGLSGNVHSSVRRLRVRSSGAEEPASAAEVELSKENAVLRATLAGLREAAPYEVLLLGELRGYEDGAAFSMDALKEETAVLATRSDAKRRDLERMRLSITQLSLATTELLSKLDLSHNHSSTKHPAPTKPPPKAKRSSSPGKSTTSRIAKSPITTPLEGRSKVGTLNRHPKPAPAATMLSAKRSHTYTPKDGQVTPAREVRVRDASHSPQARLPERGASLHVYESPVVGWGRSRSRGGGGGGGGGGGATTACASPPPPMRYGGCPTVFSKTANVPLATGYVPGTFRNKSMLTRLGKTKKAAKV